ncbi:MAG: Ig-like domain-containing protein [Flavobacteriaceae bacterium]
MKQTTFFPKFNVIGIACSLFILIFCFNCSKEDDGNTSTNDPKLKTIQLVSSNGNMLDINGTNTTTLSASGIDQFGNPINFTEAVQWSVNNSNATIDQNGNVTAQSIGSSTITAAVQDISATFNINIVNSTPVLTSLNITSSNGNELDLNGSGTTSLSASGIDQFGNSIGFTQTLQWSANNNNISIDQNGNVTALLIGTSIITASVQNVSTTFSLTIIDTTPLAPGTYIYVSDGTRQAGKVVRYNEDGSNPVLFTNQNIAWSQDIVFLEDQNIALISSLDSGLINRYNITTGNYIDAFASGISGPTRMKIGADNLLYVLQWSGNGKVLRYQLDGTFVDEFTSVGVSNSIGLDWDSAGNLYVASYNGHSVRKFDSSGNDLGVFINTNLNGPTNIWFDPNDNDKLYVLSYNNGLVQEFDSMGNFANTLVSGLSAPEGVAYMPNGNLLIGNGGTSEVKEYNNFNFLGNIIGSGSGNAALPNAITVRIVN